MESNHGLAKRATNDDSWRIFGYFKKVCLGLCHTISEFMVGRKSQHQIIRETRQKQRAQGRDKQRVRSGRHATPRVADRFVRQTRHSPESDLGATWRRQSFEEFGTRRTVLTEAPQTREHVQRGLSAKMTARTELLSPRFNTVAHTGKRKRPALQPVDKMIQDAIKKHKNALSPWQNQPWMISSTRQKAPLPTPEPSPEPSLAAEDESTEGGIDNTSDIRTSRQLSPESDVESGLANRVARFKPFAAGIVQLRNQRYGDTGISPINLSSPIPIAREGSPALLSPKDYKPIRPVAPFVNISTTAPPARVGFENTGTFEQNNNALKQKLSPDPRFRRQEEIETRRREEAAKQKLRDVKAREAAERDYAEKLEWSRREKSASPSVKVEENARESSIDTTSEDSPSRQIFREAGLVKEEATDKDGDSRSLTYNDEEDIKTDPDTLATPARITRSQTLKTPVSKILDQSELSGTPKATGYYTRLQEQQLLFTKRTQDAAAARDQYRIVQLTSRWDGKVRSAAKTGIKQNIAHSTIQIELKPHDIQRLVPEGNQDNWLNDETVNAYLEVVAAEGRKNRQSTSTVPFMHAFNSFFYTRLKESGASAVSRWAKRAKIGGTSLLSCDMIFIPINQGLHWTLAVISGTRKTLTVYNSLGSGGNAGVATHLKAFLKHELKDQFVESEWNIEPNGSSSQQDNSDDCGVFTITNARQIMLGKNPTETFSATQVRWQRRRIVAELIAGRLLRTAEEPAD